MACLGYAVRGDHSGVRPRTALVVVGALSFAACVDLTPPWEKGGAGGAGGATGGTSVARGGAGGAGGSSVGGNGTGGSSANGGTTGVPSGGSGGVGGRGGAGGAGSGGIGGGGGQGGIAGSISGSGGSGGGIDGPFAGGAGGTDGPQGGAGGGTPDGGRDTSREVGPGTPEIGPDTSNVGRDLGPDTPQDTPVDTVALPSGLVAYYPCESASGTTLPDKSGNSHDATLSTGSSSDGGPAASGTGFSIGSGGKIGNALTLAKAGYGYVSMPPAIFNGANAITVAAWIKVTTAQNWQRVFDVGINAHLNTNTSTGTKYFNLVPQNGSNQLEFAITKNGYGSANQQVLQRATIIGPSDGWKHVAVTLDGSGGSLYVDGQAVATSTSVTLRPSDLGTIDYAYIGKSQFGADPYFDGQIDEFRVYDRALSATEIQTLAQFTGH